MEADLTCTVCLDLYKDPHLLPCSHNLCHKCVVTLIRDDISHDGTPTAPSPEAEYSDIAQSMSEAIHHLSGWLSSYVQVGKTNKASIIRSKQTIICPTCRAKHDVGPNREDQFPKNLALANIVSTYKSTRSVCDAMTDSEDEHQGSNATTLTMTDSEHQGSNATAPTMTDSADEHQGSNATTPTMTDSEHQGSNATTLTMTDSEHQGSNATALTMTDSADEHKGSNATYDHDENTTDKHSQSQHYQSADHNTRYCTEHGGKRNKMFCSSCDKLVCSACALFGGHKGHDIVKVRSALRRGKRMLEDELVKVEQMHLSVLKRREVIVEYTCKLEEIKTTRLESLRKEIVKIINKIQTRENKIAEEIKTEVQKKKEILDNFHEDIFASMESVVGLSSDIMNVLSISDPMEFLSVYMQVVKRARLSNISLSHLDPTLQIVSGEIPDFEYLNRVLQRGLEKHATTELKHTLSADEHEKANEKETKKSVPGHVTKCQFMEPFYVVEDLIDVAVGAGGANIQEARQVDGITSVQLEFGEMCSFKFYGTSQDACDRGRDILQQAMIRYMSKN